MAIYSPFAAAYYDRSAPQGGGAELQMTMLARELAARGWSVAHIVLPIADPVELGESAPVPLEREPYHAAGSGRWREARAIWRALREADARVYVLRASAVYVALVALFCRLHGRRLVFSAANDFDLVREPIHESKRKHDLYLRGLRRADAVVVQSAHQLELAADVLRPAQPLVHIPSFAAVPPRPPARRRGPFLWISRVTPHKQPLEFVRLARELPEAEFTMIATQEVDDYPELGAELAAEAAPLENLTLLGSQRRERVLELIAEATAVVSTSLWEGMPNVFLEAWGRGVPVLSLVFDPDGLIFSRGLGVAAAGSWEGFVAAARDLWEDEGARARAGAAAREYLLEAHSPAAVAGRWEEVLRELDEER